METLDLFRAKFLTAFDECVTDVMAKTKGFKEWYLSTIMADTAAYAGTELIRRTVGMAQVKDVTTIADPDKRAYRGAPEHLLREGLHPEPHGIPDGRRFCGRRQDGLAESKVNANGLRRHEFAHRGGLSMSEKNIMSYETVALDDENSALVIS